MKNKLLIISGSLHAIPPTANGTRVAGYLYSLSKKLIPFFEVKVLSFEKTDSEIHEFDKNTYLRIKSNSALFKLIEKAAKFLPYTFKKKLWGRSNPIFISYYTMLYFKVKLINPNITITSMHIDAFIAVAKSLPNVKHIFYHRSSNIETEGYSKLKFLAENAACVLTLTRESMNYLENTFPQLKNKVYTIQNAVNSQLFSPDALLGVNSNFREYFGISKTDIVLGYAGRLTTSKGIDELLILLQTISKEYSNIKLIVAGDSNYETLPDSNFKRKIDYLLKSLPENIVYFTGWLPEHRMIEFYASIDIGILLSMTREGNSMFALECQASGIPVIATNVGGNPEVIVDNITGFIISPNNIQLELKEAIYKIAHDPKIMNSMKIESRNNVINNFSIEKNADAVKKAIYSIIK